MQSKILIIDDDSKIRQVLTNLLEDKDIAVLSAESGEQGLKIIAEEPDIQVVILDIWMEKMSGVKVLQAIIKNNPQLPVIMISGHANIELAVQTLKIGAYDFLEKPFSAEKLYLLIEHAQQAYGLKKANQNLKKHLISNRYPIIGSSDAIKRINNTIQTLARTDSRVIILGENGTGKELAARQIHLNSSRAEQPFVEVNCAAIPEELIESELFGHEKGSFTGAFEKTIGKFEQAHKGTLFLDEVGDMSLSAQAKMLRALEAQKIQPVGSKRSVKIDVRVISATNKDLRGLIARGLFREDLYYRLAIIPLQIRPLRERKVDIPLLVRHFIKEFASIASPGKQFSDKVMSALQNHDWPGNVRELKNMVERLLILSEEDEILNLLQPDKKTNASAMPWSLDHLSAKSENFIEADNFSAARQIFEKFYLKTHLEKHNWNISATARAIKLERSYLHKKINKYKINIPSHN